MQKDNLSFVFIVKILTFGLVLILGSQLFIQYAKAADILKPAAIRVCPVDMTSYWELNETAGTAYIDSIGNKTGACTGACPSPVQGLSDGGQLFDGRTTGIDVSSDASFNWGQNDSFSIELWMKAEAGNSCVGADSRANEVMIGRDDPNSKLHWWIGCLFSTGNARFYLGDVNNNNLILEGTSVNDGLWHHIVGVRDGMNAMNYLYVDGNLVASGNKIYNSGFGSTVSPLNIGWLNLSNGYHFEGILDEVALYNRALGGTEIQQHYNGGLSGSGYCSSDGGSGGSPTPTSTSTPTSTYTATSTSTSTPTANQTASATPVNPTSTSTPTSTYTATSTSTRTPTATQTSPPSTPTFTPTFTPIPPTRTYTPTPAPIPGGPTDPLIYVSSTSGGSVAGVNFADEDILTFETSTNRWSLFMDGSDIGLGTTDIDAFEIQADGSILISVDIGDFNIPGLGLVDDSDILRFIPNNLGSDTSGVFELYFDGSDVGLDVDNEDIDAISYTPSGDLLISTRGDVNLGSVSGKDEDLFLFSAIQLGDTTSGAWSLYFDGSDVGLSEASSEDVIGAKVDPETGVIYLTTAGLFSVAGVTGDGSDIFSCTPVSVGDVTACTYGPGLFWDGSEHGFGSEATDAIEIQFIPRPQPPEANCPADMISCWQLDETSGSTFADSSGSNPALCSGAACPSFSGGKVNGGLSFDGIDDRLVVAPNASLDWTNGESFSIAAWVKLSQSCNNNPVFVGKAKGATGGEWWFGCTAGGNTTSFYLGDSSGVGFTVQGTSAINDGEWHNLVAVRDRNANQNRLYVDSVLEGVTNAAYNGHFYNAGNLTLGSFNQSRYVNAVIDEVALYRAAIPETEIRTHYFLSRGYCYFCSTPIRIMPVGDSITAGSSSGITPDDPAYYVGYRRDLWNSLTIAGYSFDFVGSQKGGQYYTELEGFDPDHEGHPGWRDDQVAANIYNWLINNPADVVLLHIGTNSLDTNPAHVELILNEIDRYSKDVTVILARIIDRSCSAKNPPCAQSITTNTFNNNVVAMAEARIANGDKIIIVDMEDGAGINYRLQPTGDMWDGIHPYATGSSKMEDIWFTALASFLPVCYGGQ